MEEQRFRLFANSEATFKLTRPSAGAFEALRRLGLRSSKTPLSQKFEYCRELAVPWQKEIHIVEESALKELLKEKKLDDPADLSQKDLSDIHEDPETVISPFRIAAGTVPVIFSDDAGHPASVSKESEDDLLIGMIEKAIGLFFTQININNKEDLTTRNAFRAFIDSEKEYPLASVSIRNMRALNELQVVSQAVPEVERRAICREMCWDYQPQEITKSKAEYWRLSAEIILEGVKLTDSNRNLIDAGEINRALAVFFIKSEGIL